MVKNYWWDLPVCMVSVSVSEYRRARHSGCYHSNSPFTQVPIHILIWYDYHRLFNRLIIDCNRIQVEMQKVNYDDVDDSTTRTNKKEKKNLWGGEWQKRELKWAKKHSHTAFHFTAEEKLNGNRFVNPLGLMLVYNFSPYLHMLYFEYIIIQNETANERVRMNYTTCVCVRAIANECAVIILKWTTKRLY